MAYKSLTFVIDLEFMSIEYLWNGVYGARISFLARANFQFRRWTIFWFVYISIPTNGIQSGIFQPKVTKLVFILIFRMGNQKSIAVINPKSFATDSLSEYQLKNQHKLQNSTWTPLDLYDLPIWISQIKIKRIHNET